MANVYEWDGQIESKSRVKKLSGVKFCQLPCILGHAQGGRVIGEVSPLFTTGRNYCGCGISSALEINGGANRLHEIFHPPA